MKQIIAVGIILILMLVSIISIIEYNTDYDEGTVLSLKTDGEIIYYRVDTDNNGIIKVKQLRGDSSCHVGDHVKLRESLLQGWEILWRIR